MNQQKSPISQLQVMLQGILSFAALIYAIGFIIVNAYYTTFGITDYQLVQTRYFAAGLSYLIIHLGIASMTAVVAIVFEFRRKRIWLLIFLSIWALFATAIYVYNENIVNSVVVGINACVVSLIGYQIWLIWATSSEEISANDWLKPIPQNSRIFFISFGVLVVVCTSAISWGRSFWPMMRSNLGGGRPNEAIFVFDSKSIPDGGLPFIPMQSSTTTEQLPILFDQSNEFVILVDIQESKPIAVRISKSIISSVSYAPSELFGKKQLLPTLTPEVHRP